MQVWRADACQRRVAGCAKTLTSEGMPHHDGDDLGLLKQEILECALCPRLYRYTREVARTKVRRFADQTYHGGPLPGFGDPRARLLVVGLAPAAHGGNRTGRMFTGDSSADWLMRAMHKNGFASIPTSESADDGLVLHDAYVTAAARCAPPQNRPTAEELRNCSPYLRREMEVLSNVRVVLCLGGVAYQAVCRILGTRPERFGHSRLFMHGHLRILTSYHPSRQNTQTGRLSWEEWDGVFARAKGLLDEQSIS